MGLNNSKAAGDPRGDTKWADQAYADSGGGVDGQRVYDAIMARGEAERERVYETHYADQAYQDRGGGDAGDSAYNEIMSKPVRERHTMYKSPAQRASRTPYQRAGLGKRGALPKKTESRKNWQHPASLRFLRTGIRTGRCFPPGEVHQVGGHSDVSQ
jgi:hypothetical protein